MCWMNMSQEWGHLEQVVIQLAAFNVDGLLQGFGSGFLHANAQLGHLLRRKKQFRCWHSGILEALRSKQQSGISQYPASIISSVDVFALSSMNEYNDLGAKLCFFHSLPAASCQRIQGPKPLGPCLSIQKEWKSLSCRYPYHSKL